LAVTKNAQKACLRSALQYEGKYWTEFYKYDKRLIGNRGNIPTTKDFNGRLITDPIDMGNSLNSSYASLFSCERSIAQIKTTHSGEPFTINVEMIRK
jgi:hypothetical protein